MATQSSSTSGVNWWAVAASVVGSYVDSRQASKTSAMQAAANAEEARLIGQEERKSAQFKAELEEYYKAKRRAETRGGLSEFAKFSTMKEWAPGYTNTMPAEQMPVKPTA